MSRELPAHPGRLIATLLCGFGLTLLLSSLPVPSHLGDETYSSKTSCSKTSSSETSSSRSSRKPQRGIGFLGAVGVAFAADPLPPPVLALEDPNDGESVGSLFTVTIRTGLPDATGVAVSLADQVLGEFDLTGVEMTVVVDASDVPQGTQTLTVKAVDADGVVLSTESIEVEVEFPELEAEVLVQPDGSSVLSMVLQGLDNDDAFVVLAGSVSENVFSPTYGTWVPVDPATAATVTASLFTPGYAGTAVSLASSLATSSLTGPTTITVVALTFDGSTWRSSNSVALTISPPPPPPPAPGSVSTPGAAPTGGQGSQN